MNEKIYINRCAHDWFTLTAWNDDPYERFVELQANIRDRRPAKRMQYDGTVGYAGNGSLFVGTGEQGGQKHNLVVISGGLATDLEQNVWESIREDGAKLTRVDVQVTVEQPSSWDYRGQWKLFNRLKKSGKNVGWVQSKDIKHGELATVYVGSMKSDRLVRVYQKPYDDETLMLRFEAVFKGKQAHSYGLAWGSSKLSIGGSVRAMVQSVGDEQLENIFAHIIDGFHPELPTAVYRQTNTQRWLIEQVLPTFTREIMSDDNDGTVLRHFATAIEASRRKMQ